MIYDILADYSSLAVGSVVCYLIIGIGILSVINLISSIFVWYACRYWSSPEEETDKMDLEMYKLPRRIYTVPEIKQEQLKQSIADYREYYPSKINGTPHHQITELDS